VDKDLEWPYYELFLCKMLPFGAETGENYKMSVIRGIRFCL